MMTRSGFMEVLCQASPYFMNSNGVLGDKRGDGFWTQQENKIFEKALAEIDIKNPESWVRVAALIPGKTVRDVICHYRDLEDDVNHIEAGLVPFPGYNPSTFTLDWGNGLYDGGMKQPYSSYGVGAKRPGSGGRLSVQERKKGVPWTEEEHKLFLMGLKKYGKGDWRNISRNFVVTRTPTQVASHAQKYFIRLNSGGKDKRRASIHDITTVNLPDNSQSSPSIALNGAATGFSPSKNGMDLGEGSSQLGDNFLHVEEGEFTPTVEEHLIPKIGMIFDTLELAEKFYDSYAKCSGFQMRKGGNKLKDGQVVEKTFLCNKAGMTKSKTNEIRIGTTSRTSCNALVRVRLNKETNSWSVYSFHEVHNHAFTTPGRRHLLPRNRAVSSSDKIIMGQLAGANIPPCKQMLYFEGSSGGYDKVGFTLKDVRNHERDLRESLKGHDGQMLVDFFKWQKEKDPSFFYAFEQDESGRLSHCFWVDGIARLNYEVFGDVVSFDATHSTNRYGMLFVPFVGINHHWQSIFLGCGFIPNETAASFVWLFQTWVGVMKKAPVGIVTDQDRGIGAAIQQVFPNIRHRYCIWHILDKIPSEVPQLVQNPKFMEAFKANVWNSYDCVSFEEQWKALVVEFGAQNNKWLSDIYQIREKWAPVYHRSQFWAGMSSSQRSEGMNSFLKKHTQKKYSLHEFALIFERVICRQREEEVKENHRTLDRKPKLKTGWYMEEQMAQVYTLTMFLRFQKELKESLLFNVNLFEDDVNTVSTYYTVTFIGRSEKETIITYSKETRYGCCSCCMFEFVGLPCRHLLAFLKYSNCNELPQQYMMRRWNREVIRRSYTPINFGQADGNNSENFASRYCELNNLSKQQVEIGLSCDQGYEFMRDAMIKSLEGFNLIAPEGRSGGAKGSGTSLHGKQLVLSQISVEEPRQCNTKGRPSGKRLKPMREKLRKQPRKCNCCGLRGQGHDARTCPKKKESDIPAFEEDDVNSSTEGSSEEFHDSNN